MIISEHTTDDGAPKASPSGDNTTNVQTIAAPPPVEHATGRRLSAATSSSTLPTATRRVSSSTGKRSSIGVKRRAEDFTCNTATRTTNAQLMMAVRQSHPDTASSAIAVFRDSISTDGLALLRRVESTATLNKLPKRIAKPTTKLKMRQVKPDMFRASKQRAEAALERARKEESDLVNFIRQMKSQGFTREDLDKAGSDGTNALHIAAKKNLPNAIKALVAEGATVDLCTLDGRTPLIVAAQHGCALAAAALIECGALTHYASETGEVRIRNYDQ